MPLTPVSLPFVINNLASGPEPGAILDANFNALLDAINNPLNYVNYAPDTGTTNALVAVFNPPVTQLAAGLTLTVKVLNGNTGATTLNANGTGAKSVVNEDGSALRNGQLTAGLILLAVYDGTNYVLVSYANYITKVGNYAFPDVALARTLNVSGLDTTNSYVSTTGVGGAAATAQNIALLPVPANSLNALTRGMRIDWTVIVTGPNGITLEVDINAVTLASVVLSSSTGGECTGSLILNYLNSTSADCWGFSIDNAGTFAATTRVFNSGGFVWTAAQTLNFHQTSSVGTVITLFVANINYF